MWIGAAVSITGAGTVREALGSVSVFLISSPHSC